VGGRSLHIPSRRGLFSLVNTEIFPPAETQPAQPKREEPRWEYSPPPPSVQSFSLAETG